MMRTFRATLTPLSAFGSPLKGDTFFGQLCWAVSNRFGKARLDELLKGYTTGEPFAVVSDAFPSGYIPRPALPWHLFDEVPNEDRKSVKKRVCMPLGKVALPLAQWLSHCVLPGELPGGSMAAHPQPHNTINRGTGTTGKGNFTPYVMEQLWYGKKPASRREAFVPAKLDMYFVLDESRLSAGELETLLNDIGALGYGRDASIGLGKYRLDGFKVYELPAQDQADALLTLAPCAPQGLPWNAARCFYNVFTRFGRHGDVGVHAGRPFKTPVLLANTGAILTPAKYESRLFTGQGLGGDGCLSKSIPETVHQGYAPSMGIALPAEINLGVA